MAPGVRGSGRLGCFLIVFPDQIGQSGGIMVKLFGLFLLICGTNTIRADEFISTADNVLSHGYEKVESVSGIGIPEKGGDYQIKPHSLDWPFADTDVKNLMGNIATQFSSFNGGYYHGGCDLLSKNGTEIITPTAGRLEAGHYGYTVREDGSKEKYWKPWPETGSASYFEVAVIDANGYRFEFHHVDRQRLPQKIIDKLNSKNPTVEKGETVGRIISWPYPYYHHTHYNITAPNGISLNPEYYSLPLRDSIAPQITHAFTVMVDGSVQDFGDGSFSSAPLEFVVAAFDTRENSDFVHSPSSFGIEFETGVNYIRDLTYGIDDGSGHFPSLWETYMKSLRAPNGTRHATRGGYPNRSENFFLLRVKVPQGSRGKFAIKITDANQNTTTLKGEIEK